MLFIDKPSRITHILCLAFFAVVQTAGAAVLVSDSYDVQATADAANGIYGDGAPLANFNPQGGSVQGFGAYASSSGANIFATGPGLSYSSASVAAIGGGANGGALTKNGSAVTPIRDMSGVNIGTADTLYIRFLTQNTSTQPLFVDFRLGQTAFSFYTKDKTTLDYFGGNITDIPNALIADETNLILIGVDIVSGNDTISLYVNPTLNPDGSLASSALTTLSSFNIVDPNDNFDDLRVNMGNASLGVNSFDEIAIGTELSDVVSYVPEPSSLALLGMGALLVARRRRD